MGKIALKMPDGYDVYSGIEALREHFDLETVVKYYRSGELLKWMEERYYDDIADALEKLNPDDPTMEQKLCAILGITSIAVNDIGRRTKEKRALLRGKTEDEGILANAPITAFTQEDLATLLDAGEKVIYLCGDTTFSIPIRKTGQKYIGILGMPKVNVNVSTYKELEDRDITLKNVEILNHLQGTPSTEEEPYETKTTNGSKANKREPLDKKQLIALYNAVFQVHSPSLMGIGLNSVSDNRLLPLKEMAGTWGQDVDDDKNTQWEIVNDYGSNDMSAHYQLNSGGKELVLSLICKGEYKEDDVVHALAYKNFTKGWVLTTDSVCFQLSGISRIIPYNQIEKVLYDKSNLDSPSLMITLKNEENILITYEKFVNPQCFGSQPAGELMAQYLESAKNMYLAKTRAGRDI